MMTRMLMRGSLQATALLLIFSMAAAQAGDFDLDALFAKVEGLVGEPVELGD